MHVLTFILLHPEVLEISREVDRLLSGNGDAARPFARYPTGCSCKGSAAIRAGFDAFDGSERGREVSMLLAVARQSGNHGRERALLRERRAFAQSVAKARPDFGQTDPECDICGGSGYFDQSRDPSTHTDWWKIGGRWNRCFREHDDASVVYASEVEANMIRGDALRQGWIPSAIVTPDGEWYESPRSFDYGDAETTSADEVADVERWRTEARGLLEKYQSCNIVAVDCHI